ncbi:hypothetical protein U771_17685 [Pseudomonas gorinensis]|uniref:Uncharacterized protein n=1 Tax=Pseudomonas gorinensis TaxID=3240790 RepID=A0ACA7P7Y6_9PSED|nr:hypothetical protein U771_17685 [Pseudomonas sp. TKP]
MAVAMVLEGLVVLACADSRQGRQANGLPLFFASAKSKAKKSPRWGERAKGDVH